LSLSWQENYWKTSLIFVMHYNFEALSATPATSYFTYVNSTQLATM